MRYNNLVGSNTRTLPLPRPQTRALLSALSWTGWIFAAAVAYWLFYLLGPGVDWHNSFRPAALRLMSLHTPYNVEGFFGPPWALLPLAPLALLPERVGGALLAVIGLGGYVYAARRLGASWLSIPLVVGLPYTYICLRYGNLDWLVVLGYTLPPAAGLFLVLVKPQIGAVVALFWAVEAWRAGGIRRVVRTFAPVTGAFLLSFAVFGLWPLKAAGFGLPSAYWNVSLWPWSAPLGLALLVAALYWRKFGAAVIASPLLSPYVGPYTWSIVPYGLLANRWLLVYGWVGLWAWFLLTN